MSEVKIKGNPETVTIESLVAFKSLKADWEAFKSGGPNKPVEVSGITTTLSEISYLKSGGVASGVYADSNAEIEKDYLKSRASVLSQPPSERSKYIGMGFFRFLYFGFTRQRSEDVRVGEVPIEEIADRLQTKFFIENPTRTCPDPGIFKKIIKAKTCMGNVLKIIELQVATDMRYSK